MTNQSSIEATFAACGGDVLVDAAVDVARLGSCSVDYDALSDAEVLAGQRTLARAQRELDTRKAWMAKTLGQRSRWELGQSGLAAQQGFLNPEGLIQKLTGASKVESRKLVGVGRMLAEAEEAEAQAATAMAAEAEAAAEAVRRLAEAALDPDAADGLDGLGGHDGLDGLDPAGFLPAPAPMPWRAPISHAVTGGSLSIDAAHALRIGLGDIDTVVTAPVLAHALAGLFVDAETMNVDQLLKQARQVRDSLDEAGIRVREQKAWDDRYLRIWTLGTGQVRIDGLFPAEQGEFIKSTFDSFTSPRRGGVRFVDTERAAWAKRVKNDPRSTSQITCDGFLDLLKAGTTINPNEMLGGRRPAVQILTSHTPTARPTTPTQPAEPAEPAGPARTATTGQAAPAGPAAEGPATEPAPPTTTVRLPTPPPATPAPAPAPAPTAPAGLDDRGPCPLVGPIPAEFLRTADDILICLPGQAGHGYIEGNTAPISPETIERLICDSGTVEIRLDEFHRPLDLGREQRLFTRAQRRALAARDGGCRWPGCDRPPAFTEAHHIEHWQTDHGTTNINQGILLCPAHHLLLHNQRWQIFENTGHYWLRPPASIDPGQSLIEMPGPNQPRLT